MFKKFFSILIVCSFILTGCGLIPAPELEPEILRQGEVPLEVYKQSVFILGREYPSIKVVAVTNRITINDIKVNRGQVKFLDNNGLDALMKLALGRFPVTLQYGKSWESYVERNTNIREVEIDTNYGPFLFKF